MHPRYVGCRLKAVVARTPTNNRELPLAMDAVKRRNSRHAFVGRILRVMGYSPKRPVFVVGTGRCGSSLLSSILRSHNGLVVFPGEANELWHPKSYPFRSASIETPSMIEDPNAFTGISLSNWPPGHDQLIRAVFSSYNLVHGSTKTLVVKSAMISFMIPKIQILFPDASIPPHLPQWSARGRVLAGEGLEQAL